VPTTVTSAPRLRLIQHGAIVLLVGRIIGALLILQMVGSYTVNFVLEGPLFRGPGFLVTAAPLARQLGVSALLRLVIEGTWLGIALLAYASIAQRRRVLGIWLVAMAAVVLALAAAESAGVMSMVSLSQAYARAGDVERAQLESVKVAVAAARDWTHYTARLMDALAALALYAALLRCALVPRVLAGFGLLAVALMSVGITQPFFGRDVIFPLLAPLGLSHLLLALWLLAKGLAPLPDGPGRASSTPA